MKSSDCDQAVYVHRLQFFYNYSFFIMQWFYEILFWKDNLIFREQKSCQMILINSSHCSFERLN